MTAPELLALCREHRPELRYGMAADGTAIGAWDAKQGRFVPVAMLAINKTWVRTEYEVLINGEPPYKPEDWRE
jgi:hypothetical protein